MAHTDKSAEILKYLMTVEQADIETIGDNVPFGYYHNGSKYIGEIMSRLVKSGCVIRVKKGVFKFVKIDKNKPVLNSDLPSLF